MAHIVTDKAEDRRVTNNHNPSLTLTINSTLQKKKCTMAPAGQDAHLEI